MDDPQIRLFEARSLTIGTEWNTPNVQSSFWRLYRNDADGAALIRESGTFALDAGRIYFVPAGVRFTCRNLRPLTHFYAHFDVFGLPRPLERGWFAAPVLLSRDTKLESEAEELTRLNDLTSFSGRCRVKGFLFAALARAIADVPLDTLAHELAPVSPALEYIEAHLEEPMENASLAALCCISEDYFIRRFRECVGRTPNRYVLERRVQRAAQMLLFTQDGIDRIAERTGFGNRAYLSRQFSRHTGFSPAAYRKLTRV